MPSGSLWCMALIKQRQFVPLRGHMENSPLHPTAMGIWHKINHSSVIWPHCFIYDLGKMLIFFHSQCIVHSVSYSCGMHFTIRKYSMSFFGPLLHLTRPFFSSPVCRECNKLTNFNIFGRSFLLYPLFTTQLVSVFDVESFFVIFGPPLNLFQSLFLSSMGVVHATCYIHFASFRPSSTHPTGIYQDQFFSWWLCAKNSIYDRDIPLWYL